MKRKREMRVTMTSKSVSIINNELLKIVIPAVILVAGAAMMVLGILRGEVQMLFQKAIVVCLECIGIG